MSAFKDLKKIRNHSNEGSNNKNIIYQACKISDEPLVCE